jgi:hypothetical protein
MMPFAELIRKHRFPRRSAYNWKDAGLFPHWQINRIVMVRESEVLAALEKFRRVGKAPVAKRKFGPGPGRGHKKSGGSR